MKVLLFFIVLAGAIGGGAAYYLKVVAVDAPVVFRTVPVERGEVLKTISATGTLQAEEVVDVGAQVAGRIISFGHDESYPDKPEKTVDFNSVVKKDALLAIIDDTSYSAQVLQAEAALQNANASLLQLKAKYVQSEQEWNRAQKLRPTQAIADTDYDTAFANYKVAEANVEAGKAAVKQAEALLKIATTNLGYTKIVSPVQGTILARRVNVGQTVVASLNAPSIFLIAKDLRRMQVWASVNEADIGQIKLNMPVQFTVDTFPSETFHGVVTQIRMNAQMTQNVVTYTVIVTTDNSSLRLFPYLTTNVLFEVERRENVLKVPNSALRWKPKASQIASDAAGETPIAAGKDNKTSENENSSANGEFHRLWKPAGKYVEPLDVTTGISDGLMTEVSGNGLSEGMRVIVGEGAADSDTADSDATTNPFLPKMPKGRKMPGPPPG